MNLNRRHFLGLLAGATGALIIGEAIPNNRVWFIPTTVVPVNLANPMNTMNIFIYPHGINEDTIALMRRGFAMPRRFRFGRDTQSPNAQPWEAATKLTLARYRVDRQISRSA
jgi:hypothetical protein